MITDLVNGTSYEVRVRARHWRLAGEWSAVATGGPTSGVTIRYADTSFNADAADTLSPSVAGGDGSSRSFTLTSGVLPTSLERLRTPLSAV